MSNPKIALVQMAYPSFSTPLADHREKLGSFIKKAASEGADIICFPETIYQPPMPIECMEYIQAHIGPFCKDYKIWAVVGTVMHDEGLCNSAVVINRKGEVVGTYHKQHLLGGEREYGLQAGRQPLIIDTDFGRIGVVICYDIFSAKVISQYEDQGVQLLLCPSNMVIPIPFMESRQRHLVDSIIDAISAQLNCFFGIAMAYGKNLISETKIISPRETVGSLSAIEGLLINELTLDDLSVLPLLDMTEKEQNELLSKLKGL